MDRKGCELSIDLRKLIVKLRYEGKIFREIGTIIGISHSTVQRVVESYLSTGTLSSKPWQGRPRFLTTREERDVIRIVQ